MQIFNKNQIAACSNFETGFNHSCLPETCLKPFLFVLTLKESTDRGIPPFFAQTTFAEWKQQLFTQLVVSIDLIRCSFMPFLEFMLVANILHFMKRA